MRKKALGRGLDALLSMDLRESVSETERVKELDIERIDPNRNQPRDRFDVHQLEELAASIKKHGLIQPVVVRRDGDRYELIVGERRLRASKIAGKKTIPAIVREVGDCDSLRYALIENLLREDLNPIEEARGYSMICAQFGLSVQELSGIIGKSRSAINNTMRLLKLPDEVISMIEQGELKEGHARAILAIEGERSQIEWALKAARDGLSVRDVEGVAPGSRRAKRQRGKAKRDPKLEAIEDRLERYLGTRARISPRKKGGVLSIEYYSEEELETILDKMGVDTTF